MKKFLPFSSLLLLVFLGACSKNKDKTAPQILFNSPKVSNSYVFMDKIEVDVNVSDNEALNEVNYTLRLLDNSSFVFFLLNETRKPIQPSYSIVFSYQTTLTVKATYKLTVIAIDKSGNRSVEDRLIYVNQ